MQHFLHLGSWLPPPLEISWCRCRFRIGPLAQVRFGLLFSLQVTGPILVQQFLRLGFWSPPLLEISWCRCRFRAGLLPLIWCGLLFSLHVANPTLVQQFLRLGSWSPPPLEILWCRCRFRVGFGLLRQQCRPSWSSAPVTHCFFSRGLKSGLLCSLGYRLCGDLFLDLLCVCDCLHL